MSRIHLLDESTANMIAAGEVVERPASVVKELAENSIDAGASMISVEIVNGGISSIKIIDNGSGIEEEDVVIAFERHATSKLSKMNDLDSLSTMGFRGEALASIAAVSKLEITTRTPFEDTGTYASFSSGKLIDTGRTGCNQGTLIIVKELFFNVPARYKFLKKDSTEAGYVYDIMEKLAIGNPKVSLRLTSNGKELLHTPGNNDPVSVLYSIYGKDITKNSVRLENIEGSLKITGFAGLPPAAGSNRNNQLVFINGRYIRSKLVFSAIEQAYNGVLMKGKFPFAVIFIEANPAHFDINVSPTKTEARFADEKQLFSSVYHAIVNALDTVLKRNSFFLGNAQVVVDTAQAPLKSKDYPLTYLTDTAQAPLKSKDYPLTYLTDMAQAPAYIKECPEASLNEASIKAVNKTLSKILPNSLSSTTLNATPDSIPSTTPNATPDSIPSTTLNATHDVLSSITLNTSNTSPNAQFQYNYLSESDELFRSKYRVIGQLMETYILVGSKDGLYIIDQHAAHEKLIYEQLIKQFSNGKKAVQELLVPEVVELRPLEFSFLSEAKDILEEAGFNFEEFGNNSIIMRTIPQELSGQNPVSVFKEFLYLCERNMDKDGKTEHQKKIKEETAAFIACKAAIKAGKEISGFEIIGLLKDIEQSGNIFTCPHGRPVFVKLDKKELEKRFGRIV